MAKKILVVFMGLLGYVAVLFIYPYYYSNYGWAFTAWQRLASPHRFSHIIGIRVGINPVNVFMYPQPFDGSFDFGQILTKHFALNLTTGF